jgi:hypothetical protein
VCTFSIGTRRFATPRREGHGKMVDLLFEIRKRQDYGEDFVPIDIEIRSF